MIRTGTLDSCGDILVGKLSTVPGGHPSDAPRLTKSQKTFKLLFAMITEAISHSEDVKVIVRSRKGWRYPRDKMLRKWMKD